MIRSAVLEATGRMRTLVLAKAAEHESFDGVAPLAEQRDALMHANKNNEVPDCYSFGSSFLVEADTPISRMFVQASSLNRRTQNRALRRFVQFLTS